MNTQQARALLDVLAMEGNVIERWDAIKALCELWGVPIVINDYYNAPSETATIQALARHVIEAYEPSANPLDTIFVCEKCGANKVHYRLYGYRCPNRCEDEL